jgi:bifunctional UDP-N-acetylglucosamine pyrophosphorylase/glucosamine-1-phosphate N-acetyltransferase
MKSQLPKVLHKVAGRSLVGHVLETTSQLSSEHTVVVIGHGRDQVSAELQVIAPSAISVVQEQQLGTGHAVAVALEQLPADLSGPVVVLAGDSPLIRLADITALVDQVNAGAACAILTAIAQDATGYGRIVRDESGSVAGIVEHRDANDEQLAISEINSGVYAFAADLLREGLQNLSTDNSQGEQYLTDVAGWLCGRGKPVSAVVTSEENILGVNSKRDLAVAGAILRERINNHWLDEGVTMVDPSTVWIDASCELAPDVVLEPNVQLRGSTKIATGAVIGPDCTLTNTTVAADASVIRTVALDSVIGPRASVGPFTYLRPGTVLGAKAKAGGFVEMKNAALGDGAKVPHLSYVGDATIGTETNIGAATIFVNYDGVEKHHTTIGDHVRIGSDTMLVAPVNVGTGAYTAAGSVITDDVPAGAMAVGRARQRNILGWVVRRRAGSPAANAAVADSTYQASSAEGK